MTAGPGQASEIGYTCPQLEVKIYTLSITENHLHGKIEALNCRYVGQSGHAILDQPQ